MKSGSLQVVVFGLICYLSLYSHGLAEKHGATHENSGSRNDSRTRDITLMIKFNETTTLAPYYSSYTLDIGNFINFFGEGPMNFTSTYIINAIKRLGQYEFEKRPVILRVGGGAGDCYTYFTSYNPAGLSEWCQENDYSGVITAQMWDNLIDFCDKTGMSLIFGLNSAYGRNATHQAWDPTNAIQLIEYAKLRGNFNPRSRQLPPIILGFELGNEPWDSKFGFNITGQILANDFKLLKGILRKLVPDYNVSLYGPDIKQGYDSTMKNFTEAIGSDVVSALTWHYYPKSGSDPHVQLYELLAVDLDHVLSYGNLYVEYRNHYVGSNVSVWCGETSSSSGGGKDGLSNAFGGGFWYLDQLGLLAINGQGAMLRQDIYGASYGFINSNNTMAIPNYFHALVWKRTMGDMAFNVSSSFYRIRAYAHCHRNIYGNIGNNRNNISVVIINLMPEKSVNISFDLFYDNQTSQYKGVLEQFLFTGELTSLTTMLNGKEMRLDKDGYPVEVVPHIILSNNVIIPPLSYGFYVLYDVSVDICPKTE